MTGRVALAVFVPLCLLPLAPVAHLPAEPAVFRAHRQASLPETVQDTTTGISRDRLDAVERFVEGNWSRLGLPGVAVGVATADSVLLAIAYGVGTLGGDSITGHTPVHVGSVTKTFTAAVAAQLAIDGVVDLEAPIEAYLPDFTMRAPYTPRSITLRHLLEHRSGFSQWSGHDRRAQHEGRFDHIAPAGPPGDRAEYSSLNFIVLGRVLEAATGRPYATLLHDIIFQPLQMRSAFVEGAATANPDRARGHQSYFGLQRARAEPAPPPYLIPAGFAGASANDLARYGGMLVGGGEFAGARIMDPEAAAMLLGPLDETGRALGWGRSRTDHGLVLGHSGNARTTSARVRLVPEGKYALAVLATTNAGPFFDAPDDLLDGVHAILRGEPAPRPWPRERLFKGVVLAGTVLALVGMGRRAHRWGQSGYPVGLDASTGTLGRLALDLGGGAFVLFGVPRLAGVPLATMVEYFPDLGIALAASAGAGIVGGVLRAFTRSAAR